MLDGLVDPDTAELSVLRDLGEVPPELVEMAARLDPPTDPVAPVVDDADGPGDPAGDPDGANGGDGPDGPDGQDGGGIDTESR
mgnify:CR=1 FL=1